MAFAQKTRVAPEKTRADIERLVTSAGATRFVSGWEEQSASVLFELHGRKVRFVLSLPPSDLSTTRRRRQTAAQAKAAQTQEVRRRWRALLLVIKAKLEAVASGITTFEEEFLAHIVMPSGETIGDWTIPRLSRLSANSTLPRLPQ